MDNRNIMNGACVYVNGKQGHVMHNAAGVIKVKFVDGSVGFHNEGELTLQSDGATVKYCEPGSTGQDPMAQKNARDDASSEYESILMRRQHPSH